MIESFTGRARRRILLLAAAAASAGPALADHVGPSGVGSGGGLSVFGPDTLDAGHWAAGLRMLYTRPEQRSDAELEALAGQHIHAHNTDYNLNSSAAVAYGVTHHLTVSAELPYVRRDDLREGTHEHVDGTAVNGVERLGTVSGIGDLSILAKYRVTEGEGAGFALIGGIKVPTGSTHERSLEGERLETEHQPGSGSWDPIFGASASAKLGAVQLTASGLYQVSTAGAQNTRLGNRLQGGIALSHRFGPKPHEHAASHNHHHGDELDEHDEPRTNSWAAFVELAGEWEGRQKVDGEIEQASGGKWVYVAPGVRFNAASGWSAGAAVALPVWQRIRGSHPDNRYRLMLSLGRAF
jgi:Putative MetA-pathway of phenol degradation